MTGNQQVLMTYKSASAPPSTFSSSATYTGASGPQFYSVAFGAGLFVAVGSGGSASQYISSSPDGNTWTARGTASSPYAGASWVKIIFSNATFVAIGNSSSGIVIAYSTNGTSWTYYTIASTTTVTTLCIDGNGSGSFQFVANDGVSPNINTLPGGSNGGLVGAPSGAPVQYYCTSISANSWTHATLSGSTTTTVIFDCNGNNAIGPTNGGTGGALIAQEVLYSSGNATLNPVLPNSPASSSNFGGNYTTRILTPDGTNFYMFNLFDLPFMASLNSPGGWGSTSTTWTIFNNTDSALPGSVANYISLANGFFFVYGTVSGLPAMARATNPTSNTGWSTVTVSGSFSAFAGYSFNDVAFGNSIYVVVGTAYCGFT